MKVRELIRGLSSLDPDLEVLCYTEDERFVAAGTLFRLLKVEAVDVTHGEQVRLDDGTPYLKLGKGSSSAALATLTVTADF